MKWRQYTLRTSRSSNFPSFGAAREALSRWIFREAGNCSRSKVPWEDNPGSVAEGKKRKVASLAEILGSEISCWLGAGGGGRGSQRRRGRRGWLSDFPVHVPKIYQLLSFTSSSFVPRLLRATQFFPSNFFTRDSDSRINGALGSPGNQRRLLERKFAQPFPRLAVEISPTKIQLGAHEYLSR